MSHVREGGVLHCRGAGATVREDLRAVDGRPACRRYGGLSLLCCDGEAVEDLHRTLELPPGLGFNLLFAGSVDIAVGDRRCGLGQATPVRDGGGLCAAMTLSRAETVAASVPRAQRLRLLGLWVERRWLEDRCRSPADRRHLERIFREHAAVHRWRPPAQTCALALEWISLSTGGGLESSLRAEQAAIALLSRCLGELAQLLGDAPGTPSCPRSERLKQQIDARLRDHRSLADMAASLGVSVSTLQRRFKAAYGTTVVDYLRRRRLEIAREALTDEGLSIGEAAYLAGYNHPSNFVAAFRKHFDVTPARLVRLQRSCQALES